MHQLLPDVAARFWTGRQLLLIWASLSAGALHFISSEPVERLQKRRLVAALENEKAQAYEQPRRRRRHPPPPPSLRLLNYQNRSLSTEMNVIETN